jgi:hypothetical protein
LHFLTGIRATICGRGQGRSWRLQGTICVPSKATKLVGQIKISKKVKAWSFKHEIQGLSFSTKLKF